MSLSPHRGASGVPLNFGALAARVDLFALVARYSGPGKHSGHSATYSCPNPAHFDANPSFQVTTNKAGRQVARCFSQCDWHGDALDLVKWLENLDTKEAAQWLRRYLGEPEAVTFSKKTFTIPSNSAPSIPPKYTTKVVRPSAERAARFMERYLAARMWPSEVVEEFALEVVLDSAQECRVRHHFFAPVGPGEWGSVYWQDRGTSKAPQKWLSPFGHSPVLFNLRSLLEAEALEAVVICEGPADTITASVVLKGCHRVAVIGVPGANAWRAEWASYVEGLRIVIAADNDEAGKNLTEKIFASVGRTVAVLDLKDFNDLSECYKSAGPEALRLLLLAALGEEPEVEARTLEASIELLLKHFPEGSLIESETL